MARRWAHGMVCCLCAVCLLFVSMTAVIAADAPAPSPQPGVKLVETINAELKKNTKYSKFLAFVAKYKLGPAIESYLGKDPPPAVTVILPSDTAIAAYGGLGDPYLPANARLLKYHIIDGFYSYSQLLELGSDGKPLEFTTLADNATVSIRTEAGTGNKTVIYVNDVLIADPNAFYDSSVSIQGVGAVLAPPVIPSPPPPPSPRPPPYRTPPPAPITPPAPSIPDNLGSTTFSPVPKAPPPPPSAGGRSAVTSWAGVALAAVFAGALVA